MKLLFFYQHFWPDSPPYATMLRVMGEHLAGCGMDVSVMTGQPSYKAVDRKNLSGDDEHLNGVHIKRLKHLPFASKVSLIMKVGRALFPLRAGVALLVQRLKGDRYDIIVAATIPPVANGLFGLLTARLTGARFVYHFQDIYPEIGAVGSLWSADSYWHRILLKLDTIIARNADRCVVLSTDMCESLVLRGIDRASIVEINNFMLSHFEAPSDVASNCVQLGFPSSEHVPENEPVDCTPCGANGSRYQLVFAGNLGRFQDLEVMLDAFLRLDSSKSDFDLHFLGEGVMLDALMHQAEACPRVHFHGHQPFVEASRFIEGCDAGIVTIAEGVYRYAYPSKTLTYLGLGVPVVAIVEPYSALACAVRSREFGVVAESRNAGAIQAAFKAMMAFLNAGKGDHKRIRELSNSEFGAPIVLAKWEKVIMQTGEDTKRILET